MLAFLYLYNVCFSLTTLHIRLHVPVVVMAGMQITQTRKLRKNIEYSGNYRVEIKSLYKTAVFVT